MRSERLNKIVAAIGAKRYLEIGVCQGHTFIDVLADYKVGVDPSFQFDYLSMQNQNCVLHQKTSDEYFRLNNDKPFDVIFIDGLHTFEQTLRDFINSLGFSHAKTIWVLDDTVPNDHFAALPDMDRCFRLRHASGNMDWSWMGDVFKVVFFVRGLMKFFDFRTFRGHGQTVIWRDPVTYHERVSFPLHAIGSMSYDDLLDNYEMLNPAGDDDILACISHLAKVQR